MRERWRRIKRSGAKFLSWLRLHWRVLPLTLVAVAVAIAIGLATWFWPVPWDWMKNSGESDGLKISGESNGAVLRNFALAAAAAIGLPLAAWRSWVAHKQADTAERGHNNERYQKCADMLGNDVMTTRMGGVYAIERLAQEHPREYHVQIMKLLCAFLRHQARDGGGEAKAERQESLLDLDAAAQAIGECRRRLAEKGRLEGVEGDFYPDLRDANLFGANLERANFSNANFSNANLDNADLSGAVFRQAQGLSQEQLNTACQHPDGSPPGDFPDGLTWNEVEAKKRWHNFRVLQAHG